LLQKIAEGLPNGDRPLDWGAFIAIAQFNNLMFGFDKLGFGHESTITLIKTTARQTNKAKRRS
jgi:hypothetical protein